MQNKNGKTDQLKSNAKSIRPILIIESNRNGLLFEQKCLELSVNELHSYGLQKLFRNEFLSVLIF